MQDLIQNVVPCNVFPAKSWGSAMGKSSCTYVNMENHRYATIIINTGSIGTGEEFCVFNAKDKSGTSKAVVAHPFVGDVYYLTTASKTSVTQTAVTVQSVSSTSTDCIDIHNSSTNSRIIMATIDAAQATTNSNEYIGFAGTTDASMITAIMGVTMLLHGSRFQNEGGYDAFA